MNQEAPFPPSFILSVDDDADDIDLLRILFRKAGITHSVEFYRRGDELITALSELVKKSVNAVLPLICFLDVQMPSLTGHEVLRWIRNQPQLNSLAVVMVSSSEHPEDVREAAKSGAQCYLAKYPHPSVLKRVVDEAQRLAGTNVAAEWFGIPANLLLRWGLATA